MLEKAPMPAPVSLYSPPSPAPDDYPNLTQEDLSPRELELQYRAFLEGSAQHQAQEVGGAYLPPPSPPVVVDDLVDLKVGLARFMGMTVVLSPLDLKIIKGIVVEALKALLDAEVADGEEASPTG